MYIQLLSSNNFLFSELYNFQRLGYMAMAQACTRMPKMATSRLRIPRLSRPAPQVQIQNTRAGGPGSLASALS